MADSITPEQRRKCMARNRSTGTLPELRLRKALWKKGLRYRLHQQLRGHPDIVFVSQRVAIFIDGCFWHGCKLHKSIPKTNREFWEAKIRGNIARDRQTTKDLTEMGWTVRRYWEHQISDDLNSIIEEVSELLASKSKK